MNIRFSFPLAFGLLATSVQAASIAMEDQSQLQTPAAASHEQYFQPPAESELPNNAYGKMVRDGYALFVDTKRMAPNFVGNGLNCSNCHLGQGRVANSAPLWGLTRCTRRIGKRTTRSTPLPNACRAASSSA